MGPSGDQPEKCGGSKSEIVEDAAYLPEMDGVDEVGAERAGWGIGDRLGLVGVGGFHVWASVGKFRIAQRFSLSSTVPHKVKCGFCTLPGLRAGMMGCDRDYCWLCCC